MADREHVLVTKCAAVTGISFDVGRSALGDLLAGDS